MRLEPMRHFLGMHATTTNVRAVEMVVQTLDLDWSSTSLLARCAVGFAHAWRQTSRSVMEAGGLIARGAGPSSAAQPRD